MKELFKTADDVRFFRRMLDMRYLKINRLIRYFCFGLALLFCIFDAPSGNAEWLAPAMAAMICALSLVAFYDFKFTRNARFFAQSLIFLPWIILLIAEFFCGNNPAAASSALCQNLLIFCAFLMGMQQARHDGSQIRMLVTTLVTALGVTMLGIFYKIYSSESGLDSITAVWGFFATPGQISTMLVFIVFASVIFVLFPRAAIFVRLFGVYSLIFGLAMLFVLGDMAAWMAIPAGTAVLCFYFLRNFHAKSIMILLCVAAFCAIPFVKHFNANIFYPVPAIENRVPVSAESVPAFTKFVDSGRLTFPQSALEIFAENPIFGAGTGNFGEQFLNHVPARAPKYVPESCGSFPLTLLAENGLVGAILLLVPAIGIWIFAAAKTRKSEFFDSSEDARAGEMRLRGFSEERLVSACALAGTLGFAVCAIFSHETSMPALLIPNAVLLGTLFRESLSRSRTAMKFRPTNRIVKFAIAGGVPAVIFALIFPLAMSVEKTSVGNALLRPYCHVLGGESSVPANPENLQLARENFFEALNYNPRNNRAWSGLATTFAIICNYEPEMLAENVAKMQFCAEKQLALTPNSAHALWQKALADIVIGDKESAKTALLRSRELAPGDIVLLVNLGEAWRKISTLAPETKEIYRTLRERFPNDATIGMIFAGLQLAAPDEAPAREREKPADTTIEI